MSDPAAEAHHHATPKPPPSTAAFIVRKLPSAYINSFCGAAAGVASGVVTCPLDVIKTKLQAQGSFRRQQHQQHHLGLKVAVPSSTAVYRGLVGTARTIVRQDGLRGMYRGLGPMLLGYLPTWAVYMSIYDIAKTAYSPHIGKRVHPPTLFPGLVLTASESRNGLLISLHPSRRAPARRSQRIPSGSSRRASCRRSRRTLARDIEPRGTTTIPGTLLARCTRVKASRPSTRA